MTISESEEIALFISTVYSQVEGGRSLEYYLTPVHMSLFAAVSTVLYLSINKNLCTVSAGIACKHPPIVDFEDVASGDKSG